MITGADRGVLIKYNTGALSTGEIKGEDSGFCNTNLGPINITLGPNQQESLQAMLWVFVVLYNNCALSAAEITGYDREVCRRFVSHLGFLSRNLFLISPFSDLCQLVPFCSTS